MCTIVRAYLCKWTTFTMALRVDSLEFIIQALRSLLTIFYGFIGYCTPKQKPDGSVVVMTSFKIPRWGRGCFKAWHWRAECLLSKLRSKCNGDIGVQPVLATVLHCVVCNVDVDPITAWTLWGSWAIRQNFWGVCFKPNSSANRVRNHSSEQHIAAANDQAFVSRDETINFAI